MDCKQRLVLARSRWMTIIHRPISSTLALVCAAQFVLQLDFSIVNVGSQHFSPSKSPLSKRRIEITETYLLEKDAFMRYLLAHQRREAAVFYGPYRS